MQKAIKHKWKEVLFFLFLLRSFKETLEWDKMLF